MPRYLKTIIICVLFWICTVPAGSELYQYTDQNGITRLTDNIYSVPAECRSQLEQYSELPVISEDMEIQPLEKKAPRQLKTEKTIQPKTSKAVTAAVEKAVIPPTIPLVEKQAAAPEPPKKPAAAVPPPAVEKTVQPLDTQISTQTIHKSVKKTIDKKSRPVVQPVVQPVDTPVVQAENKPIENIAEKTIQPSIPQKLNPAPKPEINYSPKAETITEELPIAPTPAKQALLKPAIIPEIKPEPIKMPGDKKIASPPEPIIALPEEEEYKTSHADALPQPPVSSPVPEMKDAVPAGQAAETDSSASEAIPQDRISAVKKDAPLDLAKLEITRKSLADRKAALNKRFLGLMKEKEKIENSVNEDDEQSVLKYNEKVKRLNNKIKRYKIEKKTLQAEIEKYNNSIRQVNLN